MTHFYLSLSYIKDIGDVSIKLKPLGTGPHNAILVTAGITGLYPTIPHGDSLNALSTKLEV